MQFSNRTSTSVRQGVFPFSLQRRVWQRQGFPSLWTQVLHEDQLVSASKIGHNQHMIKEIYFATQWILFLSFRRMLDSLFIFSLVALLQSKASPHDHDTIPYTLVVVEELCEVVLSLFLSLCGYCHSNSRFTILWGRLKSFALYELSLYMCRKICTTVPQEK